MADRPTGFGLTAELAQKKAEKYDPALEKECRDWLQAVVGEPFPKGTFQQALKDGTYLCKAINKLKPGSVPKINTGTMAFKMMENIGNFLSACELYGLKKGDMFQTVDLYEDQNIVQVLICISALGRKAQTAGFKGPVIGPKEASAQKRDWTDGDLRAGQAVIGLQMGSNKGASQAGMTPYGLARQVEKTNLKS
ncbi:hypothetical protein EMCRGX_G034839 [Ephydatia muelleri]|eukprot:Em0023g747a